MGFQTYRVVSLTQTFRLVGGSEDFLVERNDSRTVLDGDGLRELDLVELDVRMRESTGDVEGSLERRRQKGKTRSARVEQRFDRMKDNSRDISPSCTESSHPSSSGKSSYRRSNPDKEET